VGLHHPLTPSAATQQESVEFVAPATVIQVLLARQLAGKAKQAVRVLDEQVLHGFVGQYKCRQRRVPRNDLRVLGVVISDPFGDLHCTKTVTVTQYAVRKDEVRRKKANTTP